MSDDRAERVRRIRNRSKPSEPTESSETSETSETGEGGEPGKQSVKDEQVGRYMYLPEGQNDRVDDVFRRLKFHYEEEYDGDDEVFEKNRQYYPLLVRYGLENLDGLDVSEVRERLDGMGLLD